MLKPNPGEKRALTTFYKTAAPQHGLCAGGKLVDGAEKDGRFQKNLEMLRELMEKKGVTVALFETYCRFILREKRQVDWVSEVVPDLAMEINSPDRNLLVGGKEYTHRTLVNVVMPITKLKFGEEASEEEGQFSITRVPSFTMGDLLREFCDAFDIEITAQTSKSYIGAFNYLLASHSLDEILYSIEYARAVEMVVTNPLNLQDRCIPGNNDQMTSPLLMAADEVKGRRARR